MILQILYSCLPSRYPVRPTQPQLIAPQHYRNSEFRDASVYVRRPDESEVYYENLAQYLSTDQTDLSPRTVRRMLKFSSREEFYAYLSKQMSASNAEQLVRESEEVNHIENNTQQRSSSPNIFYNVQNGRTTTESTFYKEQQNNRYTFSNKIYRSKSIIVKFKFRYVNNEYISSTSNYSRKCSASTIRFE